MRLSLPARTWFRVAAVFLLCIAGLLQTGLAGQANAELRQAILTAEHDRARTDDSLTLLTNATANSDPQIQCLALRALGRLERPELAERIRPLLAASVPAVRREATTAYGRALASERALASNAVAILRARLAEEQDAEVRAALCEVIGRLAYSTIKDFRSAESVLVAATWSGPAHNAPAVELLGAARGLEALIRLRVKLSPPVAATVERLRQLSAAAGEAPVRRLALTGLITAGKIDGAFLARAIKDPDDQVRRLTVRASASLPAGDHDAEAILARGLKDSAAMVRFEALAAQGRRHRSEGCRTILAAVNDRSPQVALQAIDLLAGGCAPDPAVGEALARIADRLPPAVAERGWHQPAHALASLAKLAPEAARLRLERFAAHPQWQVRAYAARAAASAGDAGLLEKLARDSNDNVRTAAISALSTVRRHDADSLYLDALTARDYQLILTSARALAGTPDRAPAVSALLSALVRLTGEHRDTSRDPRVAILQRLRELGSPDTAPALRPYLDDFDPRVAALAAEVLMAWTGTSYSAVTKVIDPGPPPQLAEIEALANASAWVVMHNGGGFELRLLADEAPATVLRFVRLARSGYYNGLTFWIVYRRQSSRT